MPFAAHETMEVHEILLEKINVISHFNLYARETKNPQLLDMIVRHQQEEIASYNEIVGITRGQSGFDPLPPNTDITGVSNQQIRYGLSTSQQFTPQPDANFNDAEIAVAMLLCHKNSARNCTWASLECADANLRRALLNCSATCTNQAYEVFLFLNEQGLYPVPRFNNERFLQRYQPAPPSLEELYRVQTGQYAGYNAQGQGQGQGQRAYGPEYYQAPVSGQEGGTMNGNLYPGSRDSVLYGADGGNASSQSGAGPRSTYGNMNNQAQMPQ